jgi:hypothetical protein
MHAQKIVFFIFFASIAEPIRQMLGSSGGSAKRFAHSRYTRKNTQSAKIRPLCGEDEFRGNSAKKRIVLPASCKRGSIAPPAGFAIIGADNRVIWSDHLLGVETPAMVAHVNVLFGVGGDDVEHEKLFRTQLAAERSLHRFAGKGWTGFIAHAHSTASFIRKLFNHGLPGYHG